EQSNWDSLHYCLFSNRGDDPHVLPRSRAFKHERTRSVFIKEPRDLHANRHTDSIDAPSKAPRAPVDNSIRSLEYEEGEASWADSESQYSFWIGFEQGPVLCSNFATVCLRYPAELSCGQTCASPLRPLSAKARNEFINPG